MNDQDKQELLELVKQDCNQVIKFLNANSLKVKDNKVVMLFSDGEVDETTIDQQSFVNLFELQFEPSLIRIKMVLQRPKELNSNIKVLMESLLNKIVNKGNTNNPYENLSYSKASEDVCPHFQSINIDSKSVESVESVETKVVLIGAICYCN